MVLIRCHSMRDGVQSQGLADSMRNEDKQETGVQVVVSTSLLPASLRISTPEGHWRAGVDPRSD